MNLRKWFAIFTRQHRESLAAASLQNAGFEVFFPKAIRESSRRQSAGGRRPVKISPLFSRYLFAKFQSISDLNLVRYSRGVVRVLGSGTSLSPLSDELIVSISSRLNKDGYFPLFNRPVEVGSQVVVDGGPFHGFIGRVERELSGGKRVALFLEALQLAQVIVEKESLRPVADC